MDSLDRDTPSSQLSMSTDALDQTDQKQLLLSLDRDQSIPEFNIQLSPWDALGWETKAAGASLPYTPCVRLLSSLLSRSPRLLLMRMPYLIPPF